MIEDYYTQSASVITVTKPSDFSTAAIATSATTIACSMNPVSGGERFAGGKNDVFIDYKMHCSSTVTINEQKRILWSGTYYDVVFVKNTLQMGHHLSVGLRSSVR